jgi:magnesium transporter
MLSIFYTNDGHLVKLEACPEPGGIARENIVWVDLIHPTKEEEAQVEAFLGVDVPTRDEMEEIEPSSRLYEEEGISYMTAVLVSRAHTDEPENLSVSFLLAGNTLITVRYSEPAPFENYRRRIERQPPNPLRGDILYLGLMDTIIDRLADILETVNRKIDALSHEIFRAPANAKQKPPYKEVLRQIGRQGDLTFKARDSLVSIQRMLTFFQQTLESGNPERKELMSRVKTQLKDVIGINDYASFVAGNINFLLDATLGMISMDQNATIKIFSVVAVVFLPPTLIASIYGMNFQHMPELSWHLGYPMALALMLLSAFLPYKLFKRNGWL